MKLSDAIFKMNPGDAFKTSVSGVEYTMTDRGFLEYSDTTVLFSVDNFDLEGGIIRAEPEVLTGEEIFWNGIKRFSSVDRWHQDEVKELVSEGIDNGQIKEWKRLKPLIDLAEIVGRYFLEEHPEAAYGLHLKEKLENLTPPWEPEK